MLGEEAMVFNRISIPHSPIEALGGQRYVDGKALFQYHTVRLKLVAGQRGGGGRAISIPHSPIEARGAPRAACGSTEFQYHTVRLKREAGRDCQAGPTHFNTTQSD